MAEIGRAALTGGRRFQHERGASLVEYALLVALIALVCFVAVIFLGESVSQSFNSSGGSLYSD